MVKITIEEFSEQNKLLKQIIIDMNKVNMNLALVNEFIYNKMIESELDNRTRDDKDAQRKNG